MRNAAILIFLGLMLSACGNIYSRFQSSDDPDIILEDTLKLLDAQEWASAIARIAPLYAVDPDYKKTREYAASGYAGRTGFSYFTFAVKYLQNFSTALSAFGGTDFSVQFLNLNIIEEELYPESSADLVSDIDNAFSILATENESASLRREATNMFLTFVSLARAHLKAKLYADADNDLAIDAGFDACSAASLPDEAVDQIMNSYAMFSQSLQNTASGGAADALSAFVVVDALLAAIGATPTSTTCVDNPADPNCKLQRSLLGGYATPPGLRLGIDTKGLDGAGVCL